LDTIGGETGLYEKDLQYIYKQSMMLRKDEINTDKFIEMSFVEFMEAIVHVCDLVCPFYEDVLFFDLGRIYEIWRKVGKGTKRENPNFHGTHAELPTKQWKGGICEEYFL